MRRPSLTPPPTRRDARGNVQTEYLWRGRRVWMRDSARDALLVIELFADGDLDPETKADFLPRMMFADTWAAHEAAGGDYAEMVSDLAWEAYGLDITGGRCAPQEAAFDWAQDAARIRASLMSAYGLDWDEASRSLSFCDLAGLLGALMETSDSTPFAEAVSARLTKVPAPTKHNKAEREAIEARKRHFALEKGPGDPVRAANIAAADSFAAAKAAAKGVVVDG